MQSAGGSETTPPDSLPLVTQADIRAGLETFGRLQSAGVMVHSSLKSFGRVEGGSRAVIEALMDVIGPQGTLMMPSFNHDEIFQEGGPGYYHPGESITTNGAIPDAFWRMPGVQRSLDPTHPIAAWGKNSLRYTQHHHRTLTMGPESPLGQLQRDGGYGLLLGVGYGANTFHHVVEMSTGAPCLGKRSEAYPVVLPDGRRLLGRTWGWREDACPLTDHTAYREEMRSRQIETQIGACRAILFRLQDCYEVIAAMLARGRGGFPACSRCPIRPRRVPQTVEPDWDEVNQRPLPGSIAWEY